MKYLDHLCSRYRLKKLACLTVFIMLTACVGVQPVYEGKSAATDELKRDTARMIRSELGHEFGCRNIESIHTTTVSVETGEQQFVGKDFGKVTEVWRVTDGCGRRHAYQVIYSVVPGLRGQAFKSIRRLETQTLDSE